jgi:hypothetical protein
MRYPPVSDLRVAYRVRPTRENHVAARKDSNGRGRGVQGIAEVARRGGGILSPAMSDLSVIGDAGITPERKSALGVNGNRTRGTLHGLRSRRVVRSYFVSDLGKVTVRITRQQSDVVPEQRRHTVSAADIDPSARRVQNNAALITCPTHARCRATRRIPEPNRGVQSR